MNLAVKPTEDQVLDAAPRDPALEWALVLNLGWSAVWSATLGAILWAVHGASAQLVAAIAALVFAGVFAQAIRLRDTPRLRLASLCVWSAAASLALSLGGGLGGPFSLMCLAPLIFGLAFDANAALAQGAALSLAPLVFGLGASLMSGAWASPAREWVAATFVSGLGVALSGVSLTLLVIAALRRRTLRLDHAETTLTRVQSLLAEQPHLLITLSHDGRLASAFGAPPPGLSIEALSAQGLVGAVQHQERAGVQGALLQAATHGVAQIDFTPRAALDRRVNLTVRRLDDGRLIGVLADSTLHGAREAALESARQQAEALNAGKSRFLANMSHELRTPLNAVIGFSDIMRMRLFGPLPERYAEYAQLIHESGGHLLELINDVLDMSKIEAARYELHREVFDAREPISAALRLVRLQAHEAEIALRGVLPEEDLTVDADRRALKQITLNLLSNALKFTPSKGAVTLTLARHGSTLELSVSDTGVGVAAEDLERLGRPFEQAGDVGARAMGSGLGLSLVKAFARLHGGDMSIESVLGEGTAVTVRLPVVVGDGVGRSAGADVIPLDSRR